MKTACLTIAILLVTAGWERSVVLGGGARAGRTFEIAKNKGTPGTKKPHKPKRPTSEA
jgi:hypothetical protein